VYMEEVMELLVPIMQDIRVLIIQVVEVVEVVEGMVMVVVEKVVLELLLLSLQ